MTEKHIFLLSLYSPVKLSGRDLLCKLTLPYCILHMEYLFNVLGKKTVLLGYGVSSKREEMQQRVAVLYCAMLEK